MILKQINKEKVKVINLPKLEADKIKGFSMFENLYSNIYLLGKKHSGKTTIIDNILTRSSDKDTRVVIFAATINKDASWIHIVKKLRDKGYEVDTYTDISEGKENHLENIIEELNIKAEISQLEKEEPEEEKINYINVYSINEESIEKKKKKKKRKKSKISPQIYFIFDDQGSALRSPVISNFLKRQRHYLSRCILSGQYLCDMKPEGIRQLDYVLMFSSVSEDKLEKLYKNLDLTVELQEFKDLYHHATSTKFSFLYVDINKGKFRKNFSHEYNLT